MKKFILPLMLLSLLCLTLPAAADSWNLSSLETEAAKAVPGGQPLGAEADDQGAFVGLQIDGMNYQFTLSADQECQMPDAKPLDYKGRKAYFFSPGMPGAGGLMILLDDAKSLTILCVPGFDSETEIVSGTLTAIADRMNLDTL